ncbi:MAG: methyltransferase domain-containing protein [Pseudomonadota bacterium]
MNTATHIARSEAGAARPTVGAAGGRTAEEIASLHAFRIERARRWFEEQTAAAPSRHCPVCDFQGPFSPVRNKIGTWCPACDSRPRHRLFALWLARHGGLRPGMRVIHFAAEPMARAGFEAAGCVYRTADIVPGFDLTLDITAMALPDASVDLLIAHHVVEHVDDCAALGEIGRVLAPGGRAVLSVPIIEGWDETLEMTDATTPEQRHALYGDPDHLRFYGRDWRQRIAAADLALTEFAAVEPDVSRHGLNRGERLFIVSREEQETCAP